METISEIKRFFVFHYRCEIESLLNWICNLVTAAVVSVSVCDKSIATVMNVAVAVVGQMIETLCVAMDSDKIREERKETVNKTYPNESSQCECTQFATVVLIAEVDNQFVRRHAQYHDSHVSMSQCLLLCLSFSRCFFSNLSK